MTVRSDSNSAGNWRTVKDRGIYVRSRQPEFGKGVSASGVRRAKAALSQWVQTPPGNCSSRKQPEQRWR